MTPLPIAFPGDTDTYNLASRSSRQFQWMIGPSLLAAPLLHDNYAKTSLMSIYLPAGTWIDIETGATYKGPMMLKDFEMPIEKIPLFVGGKGIFVRRLSDALPLKAVVYPVATADFSYTFTYPDGASTSTIVKKSTDWPRAALQVTDTTTGQAVAVDVDPDTKAISFDLTAGHDYTLHQQPGNR
jgi:alpha-glucosidase (family GH31 glycosyl hydrolase)